jgi:hypothetical protein
MSLAPRHALATIEAAVSIGLTGAHSLTANDCRVRSRDRPITRRQYSRDGLRYEADLTDAA